LKNIHCYMKKMNAEKNRLQEYERQLGDVVKKIIATHRWIKRNGNSSMIQSQLNELLQEADFLHERVLFYRNLIEYVLK
jgi:hypothetical protein